MVQCSVWSGFLTQGKIWPQQGEINIIEYVNLATSNQYALYAGQAPCSQPTTVNQTGHTSSANCTAPPVGCTVIESQPEAFGQVFANNNGGVYAMLLNDDGISMWFFTRQSIPSDISAVGNNPNPSGWGIPSAFYPASGCDPTVVFGPQIITLVRLPLSFLLYYTDSRAVGSILPSVELWQVHRVSSRRLAAMLLRIVYLLLLTLIITTTHIGT